MDTLRATGALIVVLALVFFLSWFFKRMMVRKVGNSSVARIVGGVSLGSRERLLVVEVSGQWIVVGVSPGRITALGRVEAQSDSSHEQKIVGN